MPKVRREDATQERSTRSYRRRYDGRVPNFPSSSLNLRFYRNEIPSSPHGALIEVILNEWKDDMRLLETHHGYVQWLFPIHEEGMNSDAQVLQMHEAEEMKADPLIRERIKRSYAMMMRFYGAEVVSFVTGELKRSESYKERLGNLNQRGHNWLRVSRILKWLGEVGFEHYKLPLVFFLAYETLGSKLLSRCIDSLVDFWMGTLRRDDELDLVVAYINEELSADALMREVRSLSRCPAEEAASSDSSLGSSQTSQSAEAVAPVKESDENPTQGCAGDESAHNLQADFETDGNPAHQDEEKEK